MVASSKVIIDFLKTEIDSFETVELRSLHLRYHKKYLLLGLLLQGPKFARIYLKDRKQIKALEQTLTPDLIISDNRFGCYSSVIKSVYITHQIRFRLPGLFRPFSFMAEMMHAFIYRKYSHVLIPDAQGDSLAGFLSERTSRGEYIGLLSRFEAQEEHFKKGTIAVLLSGAEPSRSQLEAHLIKLLKTEYDQVTLIRGSNTLKSVEVPKSWKIMGCCPSDEVLKVLDRAELVICRSGYSSVMDLIRLKKKALLIPTPGQPEQMYLARHLSRQGWFYSIEEKRLGVKDIKRAMDCVCHRPEFTFRQFEKIIDRLVENQ